MKLENKIEGAINNESLKLGRMGTETVTVYLTLTDSELSEFLKTTWEAFDNEHYSWELENNKLTLSYTEDLII